MLTWCRLAVAQSKRQSGDERGAEWLWRRWTVVGWVFHSAHWLGILHWQLKTHIQNCVSEYTFPSLKQVLSICDHWPLHSLPNNAQVFEWSGLFRDTSVGPRWNLLANPVADRVLSLYCCQTRSICELVLNTDSPSMWLTLCFIEVPWGAWQSSIKRVISVTFGLPGHLLLKSRWQKMNRNNYRPHSYPCLSLRNSYPLAQTFHFSSGQWMIHCFY